jgi:hypothetical protein
MDLNERASSVLTEVLDVERVHSDEAADRSTVTVRKGAHVCTRSVALLTAQEPGQATPLSGSSRKPRPTSSATAATSCTSQAAPASTPTTSVPNGAAQPVCSHGSGYGYADVSHQDAGS